MGAGFAILILSAAAVDGELAASCPAKAAVEAEIGRLGGAAALAQTGTTDITVEGINLRIVLRGNDGAVLGMREVAAPDACQERAVVAAVVVVAWLGEWSGSGDGGRAPLAAASPPAAASPSAAASPPALAPGPEQLAAAPGALVPRAISRAPRLERRAELAAFAFGVHDGDVGTWGVGAQAGYGLGDRLSVTALGEGIAERARTLGPGQATYRALRLGVGVSSRRALGRGFLDGGVAPEAVRLSLRGEGLATARAATAWGLAVDGRVRLGLRLAQVVPFVYADVGYSLTTAQLALDNRPDRVTLSRWAFAAGLGLLFFFGVPGG